VHTSYSLASTSTGRLSSSDPNLQNITIRTEEGRQIRSAFVPDAGFTLMAADYSQIELRLLAHIADIAPLKQAFKENKDIHTITAAQMFGVPENEVDAELRRKAKTINFGIIYGISAHGLATRLGIPRGQAAEYIEAYFNQYGGIKAYMEHTKQLAREQGYVTTLWGRRCHTPMIHEKNPNRRAFAERAAINAPLQGSAADIIKRAMIAVHHHLQLEQAQSRMLLQVHDELVFEIATGEEALIPRIKHIMEQVAHLDVPLVVETGTGSHWGEAH
jgi:DNA polymerase I